MIINPITKKWLDAYLKRPVSSLIIETRGDSKSGLHIAKNIHTILIGKKSNPIEILQFNDKNSIGINDIRDMKRSLSLKADKYGDISRIIAIEKSERLTTEAQNALLKIIEELPNKNILILLSENKNLLLETIQSRCFLLPIYPITKEQAMEYAETQGIDRERAKKAHIMSEGVFSDFEILINDKETNIIKNIELAKEFIKSNVFERQLNTNVIIKNGSTDDFLRALILTSKSGMRLSKTLEARKKWKKVLQLALKSQEQSKSNVNSKLVLLNLSVSMP